MFRRLRGVGYSEVIGTTTDAAGNPVELRRPTGFNPNVVQLLPVFHSATGERVIMDSPVSAGLSTTVHNFTRTGESFDCEDPNSLICGAKVSSLPVFTPGVDPVRKTLRTTLVPSLTSRPGGAVTVASAAVPDVLPFSDRFRSETPNRATAHQTIFPCRPNGFSS